MTVPMISIGAKGVISVLSNVVPIQTQAMTQAALAGDFCTAAAIQIELQPLIELLFCEVNPIPVKKALNLMGMGAGTLRLPLTDMEEANAAKLEKAMKEAARMLEFELAASLRDQIIQLRGEK